MICRDFGRAGTGRRGADVLNLGGRGHRSGLQAGTSAAAPQSRTRRCISSRARRTQDTRLGDDLTTVGLCVAGATPPVDKSAPASITTPPMRHFYLARDTTFQFGFDSLGDARQAVVAQSALYAMKWRIASRGWHGLGQMHGAADRGGLRAPLRQVVPQTGRSGLSCPLPLIAIDARAVSHCQGHSRPGS